MTTQIAEKLPDSQIVGYRSLPAPLVWDVVLSDPSERISLTLNALVFQKAKLSSDIVKKHVFRTKDNDDLLDHYFEYEGSQKELKSVNVHIKRIDSNSLQVSYAIWFTKGFLRTGYAQGKLSIRDGGVTILGKTREEIEAEIQKEYLDIPLRIEWGTTNWGMQAKVWSVAH